MMQTALYPTFGDRTRLWKPTGVKDPAPSRAKAALPAEFVEDGARALNLKGYTREFFNAAMAKTKQGEREADRLARQEQLKIEAQKNRERQAALKALSAAEKAKADAVLAQLQQQAITDAGERVKLTLAQQVKNMCAIYGVDHAEIIGASRTKEIVAARHSIIALIAADNPKVPLKIIGKVFGGRDHTTIRNSLERAGTPSERATGKYGHRGTTFQTGTPGVLLCADGRYRARVYAQNKAIECGRHDTFEQAVAAVQAKREAIYGSSQSTSLRQSSFQGVKRDCVFHPLHPKRQKGT